MSHHSTDSELLSVLSSHWKPSVAVVDLQDIQKAVLCMRCIPQAHLVLLLTSSKKVDLSILTRDWSTCNQSDEFAFKTAPDQQLIAWCLLLVTLIWPCEPHLDMRSLDAESHTECCSITSQWSETPREADKISYEIAYMHQLWNFRLSACHEHEPMQKVQSCLLTEWHRLLKFRSLCIREIRGLAYIRHMLLAWFCLLIGLLEDWENDCTHQCDQYINCHAGHKSLFWVRNWWHEG